MLIREHFRASDLDQANQRALAAAPGADRFARKLNEVSLN